MLQFEWPHKWSEQDCESVRISIESSIRDAMARGSGNAQIRGLVSVDTPNLGKRPPRIKLEGIRCLSLNRTAINLHIQYDGDFEITLRGLQVNLDTLNTSSTNDLDGSKAMPFFCPFILTVTNLVLDGMASVEIRQEVQRDWTGLHQISPTLDAFMIKNSARQNRYEHYNAPDYQEQVSGLRSNRKQWLQQASQHGLEHVPTFKVSKHRQLAMERRKVSLPASRNLVSSKDNCNSTTFNEAEYKDKYKSLPTQLSSPNIKEENEFAEANSKSKFRTLSNEQNYKYYEMSDRCVSTGASETASLALTSTSNKTKLGYGVLFAAGGRHVMRKPHAQQNAFTGLECNYNDQGIEHRHTQQTNIYSGHYNELHRNEEQKMYLGSKTNKTNRKTLNQYNVCNFGNNNNNSGLNVDDNYMYIGNNCVEFSKYNAGLKDETQKRKSLFNNETHHHEECNDCKHWHGRNDARLGSSYVTHEELQKSIKSNDCSSCYKKNKYNKYRPSEYVYHGDDNIKNNISNNNNDIHISGDNNFVYNERGNILSANVVDLLCHKVKVSKRIIKVQLFGDPLKSFSVISNFGTVPGVDNRVEETIKMLIKPIIERMMLDGLTIVR